MKSILKSETVKRFFDPTLAPSLRARQRTATDEQTRDLASQARAYVQASNPRADSKKVEDDVNIIVQQRLERHRNEVIPWFASFCRLDGLRILEVGSGHGASTLSIAEQGANIVATDVEAGALEIAKARFASVGLPLRTACVNAENMSEAFAGQQFD